MAKQSGLGDGFFFGVFDFSGDIQQLGNVGGGKAPLNVTGINKSAMERIGGIRDGRLEYTAFFNPTGLGIGSTPVFNDLPTTDVQATYCRGTAIGKPAASVLGKQVNFDGTRADDGMLTFALQQLGNGFGLEWGELHTPAPRADVAATNGAGVDGLAASAFGLQAYLHLLAFTGTSVTVKLQESSDNGVGDAFVDVVGGSFGAQTAAVTARIATAGNLAVERYLRVVTTGTFSVATFLVNVVRNATAPAF